MRLLLLRHGQSLHNVEHYIAQATCKGLTEQGRQQAERLAHRLKTNHSDCDVLLSTSMKRAHETATIISAHLNQPLHINDDLSEILPGDADGLTDAQYQAQFGAFDLGKNPDRPFAPNGESWNRFVERVKTSLDTLKQTYAGQDVIAVTHAGFIVVSFLLLIDAPFFSSRAQINPTHTAITEWQVIDNRWQLNRYNDTAHL